MSCVVTRKRHDLVEIAQSAHSCGGYCVTRWCMDCGAVVVDLDYDGYTRPGAIKPMQFPKLARDAAEPKKDNRK